MRNLVCLLAFGLCWIAALALAEALPPDVLRSEYQNCMGGETEAKSPDRARYCACVMEKMKGWTVEESLGLAQQIQGSQQPPDKIAALAKSCIDQVMRH
jgi:hypothetical protein